LRTRHVHSNYETWNTARVDIFRLNDAGKIIEHWDVLQQVPETTASGNDMFPSWRNPTLAELLFASR
jgi:predicted SnoaL-like aldol condensation-catalyzing enzyme